MRNSSLKIFKIFFSLFLVRKKIFVLFNKSYLQVIFIEIFIKKKIQYNFYSHNYSPMSCGTLQVNLCNDLRQASNIFSNSQRPCNFFNRQAFYYSMVPLINKSISLHSFSIRNKIKNSCLLSILMVIC